MKPGEFLETLDRSFPADPVPVRVLREGLSGPSFEELAGDILPRFQGRPWPALSLEDWAMLGTMPVLARELAFEPSAFLYYLPSLMAGAINTKSYIYETLEALVPFNKTWTPRGELWDAFVGAARPEQRATIVGFLDVLLDTDPYYRDYNDPMFLAAMEVWL